MFFVEVFFENMCYDDSFFSIILMEEYFIIDKKELNLVRGVVCVFYDFEGVRGVVCAFYNIKGVYGVVCVFYDIEGG